MEQCRPLYEYSWFIQKIKDYTHAKLNRDTTVKLAIQDCITTGIFADFAQKHGSEAVNMLYTQFNMEDAQKVWYREGVEDGEARGEILKLIEQTHRKLQKKKTPADIAEELEEPLEMVNQICTAISKCSPNASTLDIYNQLQSIS